MTSPVCLLAVLIIKYCQTQEWTSGILLQCHGPVSILIKLFFYFLFYFLFFAVQVVNIFNITFKHPQKKTPVFKYLALSPSVTPSSPEMIFPPISVNAFLIFIEDHMVYSLCLIIKCVRKNIATLIFPCQSDISTSSIMSTASL